MGGVPEGPISKSVTTRNSDRKNKKNRRIRYTKFVEDAFGKKTMSHRKKRGSRVKGGGDKDCMVKGEEHSGEPSGNGDVDHLEPHNRELKRWNGYVGTVKECRDN